MIEKKYIQGETWKPRLFVDNQGHKTLMEYPEDVSAAKLLNGLDLTGYTCKIAVKAIATDVLYIISPIAGVTDAEGHLDFEIPWEITASLKPGHYIIEIQWFPTDSPADDRRRFQFAIDLQARVMNEVVIPPVTPDSGIANFSGPGGTPITIEGDGTLIYFPVVMPIGDQNGEIGEITHTIDSPTQFTIYNTGSSLGQFRWRVIK